MTLISLLIALLTDRMTAEHKAWQVETYFRPWSDFVMGFDSLKKGNAAWFYFVVLGPALLVLWIMQLVDNALLQLIINTLVLMVCIGCPLLRETYKQYLQAANRGDLEACSLYADQLGHDKQGEVSFGQNLIWLNYRHYAAVIIWFAAFGAAGVILYSLARCFAQQFEDDDHPLHDVANNLMHYIDWIPVRITALGLLLVGHFSRALPVWLHHFGDGNSSAKIVLSDVAKAAEDVEPDEDDITEEPCTLVKLAKRNVTFIVVAISILTLSGWLA